MRPFLLGKIMTIDDLYELIEEVEHEQKYLFVVYDNAVDNIGIDVLDYETEDEIDGGWFKSIDEVYDFVNEHKGSL